MKIQRFKAQVVFFNISLVEIGDLGRKMAMYN